MAAFIKTLQDAARENIVYPRTKSEAVYRDDNTTTIEDTLVTLESEVAGVVENINGLGEIYETKEDAQAKFDEAKAYTDEQIAAIPTPDVSGQIAAHNEDAEAHADIRDALDAHTHSWEELEEKPFGVGERVVYLEETTLNCVNIFELNNTTVYQSAEWPTPINDIAPHVGETFIVVLNGISYEATSCVYDNGYGEAIYIGGIAGYDPFVTVGYPFSVTLSSSGALKVRVPNSGVYTIAIYRDATKTIDDKFISDTIARTEYVDTQLATKSDADHNHDSAYDTKGAADAALASAQTYTDEAVANLLNNSTEAVDSIYELRDAMQENAGAIEALVEISGSKADKEHEHSWNDLNDKPFYEIDSSQVILSVENLVGEYDINGDRAITSISAQGIAFEDGVVYHVTGSVNGHAVDEYCTAGRAGLWVEISSDNFETLWIEPNSKGTYIEFKMGGITSFEIESLTIACGDVEIIKLDEKFIPDTIARTAYVDEQLATKADSVHSHDDVYYTESEVDEMFSGVNATLDEHTHSYNDLEDKPFGDETVETVYQHKSGEYITGEERPTETIHVIYDGVDYVLTKKSWNDQDLNHFIGYYGDGSLITYPTNELEADDVPFVCYVYEEFFNMTTSFLIKHKDTSVEHTIEIYNIKSTFKTIDPKYLPEEYAAVEYVDEQIATHKHSWYDLEDKPFGEVAYDGEIDVCNIDVTIENNSADIATGWFPHYANLMMRDEADDISMPYRGCFDLHNTTIEGLHVWGNASLVPDLNGEDTGEKWAFTYYGGMVSYDEDTLKIDKVYTSYDWLNGSLRHIHLYYTGAVTETKQIDEQYIPDNIARTAYVDDVVASIPDPSWNDLKDKPFGEISEVVTVNGVAEGANDKNLVSDYGATIGYIAEVPAEGIDLNPSVVKWNGLECEYEGVEREGEGYVLQRYYDLESVYNVYVLVAYDDAANVSLSDYGTVSNAPSGIYVCLGYDHGDGFTSAGEYEISFEKSGTIKTIDEKYIPETIARVEHEHSWSDLTDKPFGEVAGEKTAILDEISTEGYTLSKHSEGNLGVYYYSLSGNPFSALEAGNTYTVMFDGEEYQCECKEAWAGANGYIYLTDGEDAWSVRDDDAKFLIYYDMMSSSSGCVGVNDTSVAHTVEVYQQDTTIKTLDEIYIPDAIARTSDIDAKIEVVNGAINSAVEVISLNTQAINAHNAAIENLQGAIDDIQEITSEEIRALFQN